MDYVAIISIIALAYLVNVSMTCYSRARNRDNMTYIAITGCISCGVWFMTLRELVTANMSVALLGPYMLGSVTGALTGTKVSIKIEELLNAKADHQTDKEIT